MKVSHILYKVSDLNEAVNAWQAKGFTVEYGTKKNPHNALIYFSEGPYLELFGNSSMPFFAKLILRLVGHGKMVDRLNHWENAEDGLIAVCLENYEDNFSKEIELLKQYQQKFFSVKTKRLDTKNRLLRFRCLFPHNMQIPFLMTYFNIDPKPKDYTHPNGVTKIKHIAFGTTVELMPLVKKLCEDPSLSLFIGKGVKDLQFD